MEEIKATISGEAEISAAFIEPTANGGGSYVLPPATSNALGGVKADPKQSGDTQPVRIGTDGKLWTAQGGGGAGGISDVQVNGISITQDGVANIKHDSSFWSQNGQMGVNFPSQYQLDNRDTQPNKAISTGRLDYAVTSVLTDGKAPALTDAQKAAAQSWLGIDTILGLVNAVSEVVG